MCKLQQSIEETSVWPHNFQGAGYLVVVYAAPETVNSYMNTASACTSCLACLAGGSDLTYRGPFNEQLILSLLQLISLAQPADGQIAWDAAHVKLMQHLVETLDAVRQELFLHSRQCKDSREHLHVYLQDITQQQDHSNDWETHEPSTVVPHVTAGGAGFQKRARRGLSMLLSCHQN